MEKVVTVDWDKATRMTYTHLWSYLLCRVIFIMVYAKLRFYVLAYRIGYFYVVYNKFDRFCCDTASHFSWIGWS